ncbi:MAG: hypothetical protein GX440_03120 [Propionibacterium sp.]|nr:hypothetical protein [Propionibacterium sp.]
MGLLDRLRAKETEVAPTQLKQDVSVIAQMVPFLELPISPMDDQLEVAGENYHVNDIKKLFRDLGRTISTRGTEIDDLRGVLVPEPWNEHDTNAVAVVIRGHHVGYLEREVAADYAPMLRELGSQQGRLLPLAARVWARADGGIVRARVTILVPDPSGTNPQPIGHLAVSSGTSRAAYLDQSRRPRLRGLTPQEWVPAIEAMKREGRYDEALTVLTWCMDAETDETRRNGWHHPAPWFFEHAAIIHRKQGHPDLEVRVIERLLSAWPPEANAGGDPDLEKRARYVIRLAKARELTARQIPPAIEPGATSPPDGMPRSASVVVLPRGSKLNVTGEEAYKKRLWGWLAGRHQWPVMVTLHAGFPARSSAAPRMIVRLFGEQIGQLTPSTTAQLRPIVEACEQRGLLPVCHAIVKGNELKVDVIIDVAKGSDLSQAWLEQNVLGRQRVQGDGISQDPGE